MSIKENLGDLITKNKENAEELSATNNRSALNKDETEKKITELILVNKENAIKLSAAFKIISAQKKEIKKREAELIHLEKELAYQSESSILNKKLMLANEQEKLSKEKYIDLYNFAPTGYFTISPEGKILELNLAGANMLGKNQSQLKNRLFHLHLTHDSKPVFLLFLEKLLHSKITESCELTLLCDVNPQLVLHLTGIASENDTDCFITAVDITGRKLAEDKLIESNKLFHHLFSVSPDAIMLLDPTDPLGGWPIVNCNEVACSMNGYKREELIGKSIDMLNISTGTPEERAEYLETLRRKSIFRMETFHRHRDGHIFPVEVSTSLINFGERELILGIDRDITEHKRAEEKLRSSEEKFKVIFDYAPDAYYLSDLKGNFIEGNIAAEKMLGYDKSEVIGKNFLTLHLLSPNQLLKAAKLLGKNLLGKATGPDEFVINRKDGSKVTAEISTHPVKIQEHKVVLGIARDITKRKRAEEALLENEAKYRTLVTQSPDGIFIVDLSGTFLSVNKTMCDNLKYSEEELLSMKLWNIIPLEYVSIHKDRLADIVKGKRNYEAAEYQVKGKDGNVHSIEVLSAPYYKDKAIIGFQGIARDVTKRKQAENDLIVRNKLNLLKAKIWEAVSNKSTDKAGLINLMLEESGNVLDISRASFLLLDEKKKSFVTKYQWYRPEAGSTKKVEIPAKYVESYLDQDSFQIPLQLNKSILFFGSQILNQYNIKSWLAVAFGKKQNSLGLFTFTDCNKERVWSDLEIEVLIDLSKILESYTIQREAENALRESEKKYESLFRDHPQPMWIYDVNSLKFLEVNEAATKDYGYTKEEFLTMSLKEIRPEEDVPKLLNNIETHKEAFQLDESFRHKKKDGTIIQVNISSQKIHFSDNKNHRLVMAIDITDQYNAQKELLKLSHAVEQSPVSIVITDKDGIIEYGNPKVTEAAGYKLEELIGKNSRIFNSGEKLKSDYKILWDTISSGKEWFGEFHNKKKNGELFWESASISPILNNKREITHYVAVKEDITKRKETELELIKAKEKAEESDRLKSAFLANMSHEIRTPMNGILGFAELLKEAELSGEEQLEYIEMIEKSGARMLNIISDIVSISKIESGTLETHISDTNINGQTEFVYNLLRLDAEKKNLDFILKNGLPDQESILKTDQEKFIGILSNLVKNAIKYTDQGSIEFGYTLLETHGIASLQFYIKDSGIGIPKDRQEAIFERFIQADIEDKMARQGAGLGLAISKAYVDMLGGKIWVESEPNCGSTFYFSIPYNNKTKEKTVKSNLSSDLREKFQLKIFKVLIVEDDETSEKFLKEIIRRFSHEVFTARNGLEAVNLCHQNPDIDLILMDIQMPEMNGYKAIKQIRQFNKDVIIIAQTACGLEGDREKSIDAGCNDHLSKPFKINDLRYLLMKHFNEQI